MLTFLLELWALSGVAFVLHAWRMIDFLISDEAAEVLDGIKVRGQLLFFVFPEELRNLGPVVRSVARS